MRSKNHLVSRDKQFGSKKASRSAAANSTFEEKVEKLLQLQQMSFEIANQTGRVGKKPWQIQVSKKWG
jgi:hypothetical protein